MSKKFKGIRNFINYQWYNLLVGVSTLLCKPAKGLYILMIALKKLSMSRRSKYYVLRIEKEKQ